MAQQTPAASVDGGRCILEVPERGANHLFAAIFFKQSLRDAVPSGRPASRKAHTCIGERSIHPKLMISDFLRRGKA